MTEMKRNRFTEEQIIGFLKQSEAGLPVKELCRRGGFQMQRFINGDPNMEGWRHRRPDGLKRLKVKTPSSRDCERKRSSTSMR